MLSWQKTIPMDLKDKAFIAASPLFRLRKRIGRWVHYNSVKLLHRRDYGPKVFCIGYNKTGTTSLGKALGELGYRHSSFNRRVYRQMYQQGKVRAVLNYTARFESFDDLPWLLEDMIPRLDETFPGSRYIHLLRDEESWKGSMNRWYHKKMGEYPNLEEKVRAYRAHSQFVKRYFEGRSSDILILEINDPNGFDKLATFLGKKAPRPMFGQYNATEPKKQTP